MIGSSKKKLPLVFGMLLLPLFASAQTDPQFYDYPQNHLDWFTIESSHFMVHFQEGNSRSAQVISRIAEEIYPPITNLYQYEPEDKVSIVIKDREDYSNGAAYFFDNKIDIWLPALNTPLRGTHNWLRNVITHEYTHIVQIQTAMKRSRKIPAVYFQWLSYEDTRRPDVLYGFPKGIVTMPFATVNVPAWLAEGTAQYQTAGLYYESWDSHRDMILRTRILSDTYFNLQEMGTFSSKNSLERETVYNQGYAFVIYLAHRFGDDILRKISLALGENGVYTVEEAIERATGTEANKLFQDWVNERKEFYQNAVAGLETNAADTIEKKGFFNFYPKLSPDGTKLAYLSNKGQDSGVLSLYIVDRSGETKISDVDVEVFNEDDDHINQIKPGLIFLETSFSFSPDSKKIAYSINRKNKFGETYRDIFIYDIESGKSKRLTHSARLESPAWNHKGDKIAAVQFKNGTQNLVLINPDTTDSITTITSFEHGETVHTPAWNKDDSRLYFSASDLHNRNILVYELENHSVRDVLRDEYIDFRDPYLSTNGEYLYYAADPDGIFNIYRMHLQNRETEKISSVTGGAFMPFVSSDEELFYSEYQASGYKIMSLNVENERQNDGFYDPHFADEAGDFTIDDAEYISALNQFDDSDIQALDAEAFSVVDTGVYKFKLPVLNEDSERSFRSYSDTYTGFGFFPVLRFDNYSKPHGNNGALIKEGSFGNLGKNLVRDFKIGTYFSSRDVIDKLSFFGGIMVGPASQPAESIGNFFRPDRLVGLDRDIFLILEHRGLPFIKRSWSPTVALELYNMRRNVADGLSVEEFICTSCPEVDTVKVDIAYDIWEAGLYLRSKLSRRSLLEIGVVYSPYRVSTDNFYSRELKQQVTGSSSQYFRGTTISASYTFDYYHFTTDADIAPAGLKGYLRYQFQPSKLLEEYQIKEGSLVPVFKSSSNHSTEVHFRYGLKPFGDQTFQARLRGFHYFNNPGDSFYTDYIGGFMGMRSYPFFALGGNTTAFGSFSWFTPLYKNITKQVGPFTIDKLYARFFFETGNGWESPYDTGNKLKTGVGAELRLALNGYYLFPLKFFVSAAYGFDRFSLTLPDDFITSSQSNRVQYGRELLFHFGLTFDFELL